MDNLIALVIGVFLGHTASRSQSEAVPSSKLRHWLNKRRFNSLRTKAIRGGFGAQFDEQWRPFQDQPFALQHGMESVRAFHQARSMHRRT